MYNYIYDMYTIYVYMRNQFRNNIQCECMGIFTTSNNKNLL